MSVWLAIPSARPNGGTIPQWAARGYKIAVYTDALLPGGQIGGITPGVSLNPMSGLYPGYAKAVNALCREILANDPSAEFCIIGGDDTQPDLNHAPQEIAQQIIDHFGGTFAVCQPTGDRFAGGSIDRIAGSAWMGREWCLRANQGAGPLWPELTHMFTDELLMCVAEKLGVYWRRPDLIHLHHHYMRQSSALNSPAVGRPIPDHLKQWSTQKHWDESKAIFERLKAQDFAPCTPLPVEVCA